MGGEYVEGNVIDVEVTQCDRQTANHAMWHFANWQLWGKVEDKLAWRGLAGFIGKEEIIAELQKTHGEWLGKHAVENKLGIHSPQNKTIETCRLGGEATFKKGVGLFSKTNQEWEEIRSKGGESARDQNKGIFAQTIEERKANSSLGGKKSASSLWEDPLHPELGQHPANMLALKQKRFNLPSDSSTRVKVNPER